MIKVPRGVVLDVVSSPTRRKPPFALTSHHDAEIAGSPARQTWAAQGSSVPLATAAAAGPRGTKELPWPGLLEMEDTRGGTRGPGASVREATRLQTPPPACVHPDVCSVEEFIISP